MTMIHPGPLALGATATALTSDSRLAELAALSGPVEARMPDDALVKSGRPSQVSLVLLTLTAILVTAVYIGMPLMLAVEPNFGSMITAAGSATLILVSIVFAVLGVLRRTATSKERVSVRSTAPTRVGNDMMTVPAIP